MKFTLEPEVSPFSFHQVTHDIDSLFRPMLQRTLMPSTPASFSFSPFSPLAFSPTSDRPPGSSSTGPFLTWHPLPPSTSPMGIGINPRAGVPSRRYSTVSASSVSFVAETPQTPRSPMIDFAWWLCFAVATFWCHRRRSLSPTWLCAIYNELWAKDWGRREGTWVILLLTTYITSRLSSAAITSHHVKRRSLSPAWLYAIYNGPWEDNCGGSGERWRTGGTECIWYTWDTLWPIRGPWAEDCGERGRRGGTWHTWHILWSTRMAFQCSVQCFVLSCGLNTVCGLGSVRIALRSNFQGLVAGSHTGFRSWSRPWSLSFFVTSSSSSSS